MNVLNEATGRWGNTTLIESDPGEETCRSAIFVPFRRDLFFHADTSWGVYHRDGRLVEAAAYYRGPNQVLVGQSPSTALRPSDLPFINEELVYGGPFIMHYGHFITAALPRLWHLRAMAGSRVRILCHGHEGPDIWFAQEYVRMMLTAIGLSAENFVRLETPSVIRHLWVPRPAMEEQNFIHRAFDDLGTAIGRAYGVHREQRSDVAIYLSKRRLAAGITRFEGEGILEDCLAAVGVAIVHPQEHSFPDQIRLLARARAVAATAGSALHTTLFLDRPSRIVALTGSGTINANYALIDRVKGNDSLYLCPQTPAAGGAPIDGFQSNWVIENIQAVASAFAERI